MSEYYTLKGSQFAFIFSVCLLMIDAVSPPKDVKWKPRFLALGSKSSSFYVEVELGKSIQRTNTIKKAITPPWEETLPL